MLTSCSGTSKRSTEIGVGGREFTGDKGVEMEDEKVLGRKFRETKEMGWGKGEE